MKLAEHPTAKAFYERAAADEAPPGSREPKVEADWLRHLALDSGAGDAGIVEIARPALAPQRDEILRNYPWTKSLLSFVVRMAREPVRGAPRSVANLEFHRAGDEVNEVGAAIVTTLEARGIRAVNPSMGFPMEMYQSGGGALWVVSHKPVAVEARHQLLHHLPYLENAIIHVDPAHVSGEAHHRLLHHVHDGFPVHSHA